MNNLFVFYTDFCVPQRFAGVTVGPVVFIRPEYRDDVGLLHHEMTHVKQFWRNPLKVMLSPWVKKWRLELEVEAYKVQLGFSPYNTLRFAEFLSTRYNLDITVADAAELLK